MAGQQRSSKAAPRRATSEEIIEEVAEVLVEGEIEMERARLAERLESLARKIDEVGASVSDVPKQTSTQVLEDVVNVVREEGTHLTTAISGISTVLDTGVIANSTTDQARQLDGI